MKYAGQLTVYSEFKLDINVHGIIIILLKLNLCNIIQKKPHQEEWIHNMTTICGVYAKASLDLLVCLKKKSNT